MLSLLLSATAAASPPRRLTHDEITAAGEAAEKQLPPVDKVAITGCSKLVEPSANAPGRGADYLAIVTCYRNAGAIGIAITMWERASKHDPMNDRVNLPEDVAAYKQMILGITTAYESAGVFSKLAELLDHYARQYASGHDAIDAEKRAACLWFQLGDNRAQQAITFIQRGMRHQKLDPDHMCDGVKLIVIPASAP